MDSNPIVAVFLPAALGIVMLGLGLWPTLLNDSVMAIPPAIYSLIMFFTAAAFGWLVARRAER